MTDKIIVLTAGSSWTVPSDFTSINTVECFGGGGGGSSYTTYAGGLAGGGGGSGAYARISNLPLSPSSIVAYGVGAGGSAPSTGSTDTDARGGIGGATFFNATSLSNAVANGSTISCAAEGARQAVDSWSGGLGGRASASVGTATRSGSDGGGATIFQSGSGGGAGAPGSTGVGGAGAAGSSADGAGGGGASDGGAAGSVGSTTAGGDGGARTGGSGGGGGAINTVGQNGAGGNGGGGGGPASGLGTVGRNGGSGGNAAQYLDSVSSIVFGPGGGGGGGGSGGDQLAVSGIGGTGGNGAGGGGGTTSPPSVGSLGGNGGSGFIVITYTANSAVENPTLSGSIDITPVDFEALLASDGATNGAIYRVDTSGGPVTIAPAVHTKTTKGFTFYASHRGGYDENPLGDGAETVFEALFPRLLTIETLWEMVIPAGYPMRADYVEFRRPPALWPDWTGSGEIWSDLPGACDPDYLKPWGIITPTGGPAGVDLELNYSQITGGYGPSGGEVPARADIGDFDAPPVYYQDPAGRAKDTLTGAFTVPNDVAGVVPNIASCRNNYGGTIYGVAQKAPPALRQHPSSGYACGIKARFLHVRDITNIIGMTINALPGHQIDIASMVVDRSYGLMHLFAIEGMNSDNAIDVNGMLFRGCFNDYRDLYGAHSDLGFYLHNHPSFMNWTAARNWFLFWSGEETAPAIGLRHQPTYGGSTIPSYSDGPIQAHIYLPGANGCAMIDNLTLDPYQYDVVGLNPAYRDSAITAPAGADTHSSKMGTGNAAVPPAPQTYGLQENIVSEGVRTDCAVQINVTSLTIADSAEQVAVFGSDILTAPSSPRALFDTLTAGRSLPWSTLGDFLRADDWAHLPVHIQPPPMTRLPTSTAVSTIPVNVFGKNRGDSFSGTVAGGAMVEVRSRDARPAIASTPPHAAVAGTLLASASTTPTFESGMKAVFKATTPSTKATVMDHVLTAGGRDFTWRLITQSDNQYPTASMTNFRLSRSGFGSGSGTSLSFFAIVKPADFSSQKILFDTNNGSSSLTIKINSVYLQVAATGPTGNAVFSGLYAPDFSTSAFNTIAVTIDTTQANLAEAVKVVINGASPGAVNSSTYTRSGLIDLSGTLDLFKDNGGSFPFGGEVAMLAATTELIEADFLTLALLDQLCPETASGTTAAGTLGGKPLSPTNRQFEMFFAGKKTRLEGGTNDGSLGSWTASGTVTQVINSSWPL